MQGFSIFYRIKYEPKNILQGYSIANRRGYLYPMKFEVGDPVLLLHSNEEGTVVEILNENMLLVNVEGIEFPVFSDQVDFPYFKRFNDKKIAEAQKQKKIYIDQVPVEKFPVKQHMRAAGVQLQMIPHYDNQDYEDTISDFKLYLINSLNTSFHFEYSVIYKDEPDFVLTNTIGAYQDFYLNDISQAGLNDIVRFQFLFSLFPADKKKEEKIEIPLKVRPKILFQKIEEMHMKNEPSFSFLLFETYPDKEPKPYFPPPDKMPNVRQLPHEVFEQPLSVIDLHIEKISPHATGFSNFEMLQTQLQYFEKYFDLAVAHLLPKLIVIHGIGSGKLRHEVHEILRHKKEVKSFVNQYHPNFGFGATEIYFQY